jgi:hypothetical protein
VLDASPLTVGEYSAITGDPINASLIMGLNGASYLAVSGNTLFVANLAGGTVGEYNATTGAPISPITPNIITGLSEPVGLAVSGNNLFVASYSFGNGGAGTVGEYNLTTGTFNSSLITGLNGPWGLAIASVPEPSAWSMIGVGGVALLGITLRKRRHIARG